MTRDIFLRPNAFGTRDVQLLENAASGGAVLSASVNFVGAGTAAYSATRKIPAAVAFSGAGSSAFAATRRLSAEVSWTGTGTVAVAATARLAAGVSFTGAGAFAASGTATLRAAVSFGGAGSFATAASGAISFVGAGTFSASATVVPAVVEAPLPLPAFAGGRRFTISTKHNAKVAFRGDSVFNAEARQRHAAAVAFDAEAIVRFDAQVVEAPIIGLAPVILFRPAVAVERITAIAPVIHAVSVAFASASLFEARARVIEADRYTIPRAQIDEAVIFMAYQYLEAA